jgi:hypothetical protein
VDAQRLQEDVEVEREFHLLVGRLADPRRAHSDAGQSRRDR